MLSDSSTVQGRRVEDSISNMMMLFNWPKIEAIIYINTNSLICILEKNSLSGYFQQWEDTYIIFWFETQLDEYRVGLS